MTVVRVEIIENAAGEWYFNAVAGNNEVVATGESYTRRDDAIRAAEETFPGVEQRVKGEDDGA